MNAALCDFSIRGALEKHLLTYLLTAAKEMPVWHSIQSHTVPLLALPLNHLTSSSAMTERPRELGYFKGVGDFEAKF